MPDEHIHLTPAPTALFAEVDRETVLLNLHTERYYVLDDIGTRCWQLIGLHGDLDAVVAQLATEFDGKVAMLRSDVTDLVGSLRDAGLLTVGS